MKRWGVWGLITLAAVLRIRQYAANRSLWLDEAKLSLNVLHRNFAQLWQPLDYHQGGPIGFLLLQKSATLLLGTSEYALRLVPLLAGILSIFLFYLLAKRVTSAAPLALALFAMSPSLIYYSSEVKQYSSDVMVALLLLYLGTSGRAMLLGVFGAIAVWFSHPAIFVLAGIGFVMVLRGWKYVPPFLLPAASFLLCYFTVLRKLSQDAALLAYWQPNFIPKNLSAFKWLGDSFFDFFASSGALTFLGLAGFAFLCGCISLFKRNKEILFLLLSPVVLVLLASAAQKYPFGGRLTLFMVPVALLLMAEGAETLRVIIGNQFGVILVLLLLLDPGKYSLHRFVTPFKPTARAGVMPLEEMRPVVREVEDHIQSGDYVYLYHAAQPAFRYYAERLGFSTQNVETGIASGRDPHVYEADTQQLAGKRVWVVLSHMEGVAADEPKYLRFAFDLHGQRVESFFSPGAEADLYEVQP
jgi:hypothetical protein